MNSKMNESKLDQSTYHLLKRAAQYANNLYMQSVGRTGLTQRQFTVLVSIHENSGINQTQLVKLTGIDRSTLADLVARLADQGYLSRKRTKYDARINTLRLTPAGEAAIKSALPGASDVDEKLLAAIPKDQRSAFIAGLHILSAQHEAVEQGDKSN